MRLLPKIDEFYLERIKSDGAFTIDGGRFYGCEIQICRREKETLAGSFDACKRIIEHCLDSGMRYFVIHPPESLVDLNTIGTEPSLITLYNSILRDIAAFAPASGCDIDVLFHGDGRVDDYFHTSAMRSLDTFSDIMAEGGCGILIENVSAVVGPAERADEWIMSNINKGNIMFCYDICHQRGDEYRKKFEIPLKVKQARLTKNVHFSKTANYDGQVDVAHTHAQPHVNEYDLLADILYIKSKGIDLTDLNVVIEVLEDDYVRRPNERHELELFEKLKHMDLSEYQDIR